MNKRLTLIVCLCFLSILILSNCNKQKETSAFYYNQLIGIDNWNVISKDSTNSLTKIEIMNQKWFMHFMHWWPLTKERKNISIEYTKNLLLSLWGSMLFELNGVEGKTIINGHKAYYVEGIFKGIVKTRFILWNCPETNRQFLSDCNINTSMETPNGYLDLQISDITNSIACHESNLKNNPKLSQKINYKELNISFSLPIEWRSELFFLGNDSTKQSPGYYVDGITDKEGAMWNLTSDSKKEILFIKDKNITEDFEHRMEKQFSDTIYRELENQNIKFYYTDVKISKKNLSEHNASYEGTYKMVTYYPAYDSYDTTLHRYNTYVWRSNSESYFLKASMIFRKKFWGIPIDLSPRKEQYEQFIKEEVLSNISNHPF